MSSLAKGQALRFVAPPGQAFVMIDGGGLNAAGKPTWMGWLVNTGGRFEALAANSSDDGCAVISDATSQRFEDPCHGAAYAIDGHVLRGPATTSLSHLGWRVVAADRIAVESLAVWTAV
jgi:Rieske Fe-S protein